MNTLTPFFGINPFVRRQTVASHHSHWTISDLELLARVEANWDKRVQGYRPGCVLVPIDPDGCDFVSNVVQLKEGDAFGGVYAPRRPGEAPRKQIHVVGASKMPAKSVEVVLYSRETLAEDPHEPPVTEAWSIISVNASPLPPGTSMPMTAGTLMANHFHVPGSDDGGTSTGMTNDEFVAALRVSFEFWKDKGMAPGSKS